MTDATRRLLVQVIERLYREHQTDSSCRDSIYQVPPRHPEDVALLAMMQFYVDTDV